jgi:hypothetical protein
LLSVVSLVEGCGRSVPLCAVHATLDTTLARSPIPKKVLMVSPLQVREVRARTLPGLWRVPEIEFGEHAVSVWQIADCPLRPV